MFWAQALTLPYLVLCAFGFKTRFYGVVFRLWGFRVISRSEASQRALKVSGSTSAPMSSAADLGLGG